MLFDLLMPVYTLNLNYGKMLAADLPDERWAAQPVAGMTMNHAAWTVGHLAFVHDGVAGMIGGTPALDESWKALFAPGTKPLPDRSAYPAGDVLLRAFEASHARLADAAARLTPEAAAGLPPERLRARFPTIGHMTAGLMTAHFGTHLGQLSAWRRAMGLPSVF
jgi:hypothetical protein